MTNQENPMKAYLLEEYLEDYAQKRISRRQALGHLAALTGSIAGALRIFAGAFDRPKNANSGMLSLGK